MNIKSAAKKIAVGSSLLLASGAVFAEDSAITTAIEAGRTNVALVVAGVVAVSALGFGLGMIKSWLGK